MSVGLLPLSFRMQRFLFRGGPQCLILAQVRRKEVLSLLGPSALAAMTLAHQLFFVLFCVSFFFPFFFPPTAESFGVSGQIGSGVVRGDPEVRFHESSTRVPPGFHPRGFLEVLRGMRGGASTKAITACCWDIT